MLDIYATKKAPINECFIWLLATPLQLSFNYRSE